MNTNVIHELRKNKHWVKVSHKRFDSLGQMLGTKKEIYDYYKGFSYSNPVAIDPHGGITEMDIVLPDTKHHFFAKAVCRKDESFNRKVALNICLGRILKQVRQANIDTPWPT